MLDLQEDASQEVTAPGVGKAAAKHSRVSLSICMEAVSMVRPDEVMQALRTIAQDFAIHWLAICVTCIRLLMDVDL